MTKFQIIYFGGNNNNMITNSDNGKNYNIRKIIDSYYDKID